MPRSRADIEAQLKDTLEFVTTLEAELAEVQPDRLVVTTRYKRPTTFSTFGEDLCIDVEGTSARLFRPVVAGQLRDWLNYHFPKENA